MTHLPPIRRATLCLRGGLIRLLTSALTGMTQDPNDMFLQGLTQMLR